mmetsp:Transcript_111754/g.193693  ORF Transcript_111754/g.193693 Transcript_111754/m.193693 type:complete len:263 (+) Transcript_111754:90-878(+)
MVFLIEASSDSSSEENIDVSELNATQEKVPQVFETSAPELIRRSAFRGRYLKKLTDQKVWVPKAQRTPDHQTVVIFDWDDTLLCTSYLNSLDCGFVRDPAVQQDLKLIEEAAISLLESGLRLGHVFIITNAMKGWVESSAARWMPGILPMLRQVPVISARSSHEAQYPGEVGQWKKQAFLNLQRQLHADVITNLISVGDSNFELEAVHAMGKAFATSLVKTIKLKENPTAQELAKQLALIKPKLEKIVEAARNMKIQLERKN